MLSAQVDELRELATRYDELQVGAVKAIKMHSGMGLILHDAADVIDRLSSENTKLREENSMLRKYTSKALSAISYCCDCCPYADCGCDTETVPMHDGCKAFEELREMGVEVE